MHVQSTGSGKKEVTGANVLVAIFGEKDSHAVYYLHQQGVTRLDVVNFIAHGIKKSDPPEPAKSNESSSTEGEKEEAGEGKGSPLDQFTQNLNQLAREGKIDPLIGREHEVERVIQVLCRRRKNNPLLVGEAGVGKTAIAEGLAWRITQDDVPEVLGDATVYALDMGALLAGTKYRGDFEQRLKGVLKALKDQPSAILFIDEIHTLIGAGAASGGTLDASNLLKPALSLRADEVHRRDHLHRVPRHLREGRGAVAALPEDRRRRAVGRADDRDPEGPEVALRGAPQVKYALTALQAAAELSAKYINDRHLPDKAIDVIDEAGAAQRILPKTKQKKTITRTEVEEIVAKIARIPPASVSSDDRGKLKTLDRDLKSVVFGQDAGDRRAGRRHQDGALRPGQARQADRLVPVLRPHRRRQDRGRQAARVHPGHRADPLRHERVHGAPRGQPPDRRAAGLRRLRPGRPADRGDHARSRMRCCCSTRSRRRTRTSSTCCCR